MIQGGVAQPVKLSLCVTGSSAHAPLERIHLPNIWPERNGIAGKCPCLEAQLTLKNHLDWYMFYDAVVNATTRFITDATMELLLHNSGLHG